MDHISVDLASPVTYGVGEELEVKATFSAPEDGSYYLLGALYTADYGYISGTMFGVILPEGATYAINSGTVTQLWEMSEGDEQELDCKLTLGRTGVILGLFLMRLAGETPSLDDDIEIGCVNLTLEERVPFTVGAIDWTTLLGGIVIVSTIGMVTRGLK